MRILTPIQNVSKRQNKFRNIGEVEALLNFKKSRKKDKADCLKEIYNNSLIINTVLSVFEHQFKTHKKYLDVKEKAMSLKTEMLNQRNACLKSCRPGTSRHTIVRDFNNLTQGAMKSQISFKGITYYYAGFQLIQDDNNFSYEDYWFCLTKDSDKNFSLACLPTFRPPETFDIGTPVLDIDDILLVLADEGFEHLGKKYDCESMHSADSKYTAR